MILHRSFCEIILLISCILFEITLITSFIFCIYCFVLTLFCSVTLCFPFVLNSNHVSSFNTNQFSWPISCLISVLLILYLQCFCYFSLIYFSVPSHIHSCSRLIFFSFYFYTQFNSSSDFILNNSCSLSITLA